MECILSRTTSCKVRSAAAAVALLALVATALLAVAGPEANASQGVTRSLVSLYTFNEGSGTVVNDVARVGKPADLRIVAPSATKWVRGGLDIVRPTLIVSSGAATKVTKAVKASGQISIEAWVRPAAQVQNGPARILSLAGGSTGTNHALIQGSRTGTAAPAFTARTRTTATAKWGATLQTDKVASTKLTHLVFTRDASGVQRMYVNGTLRSTSKVAGGLDNWDSTYRLALGGEFGRSRFWLGGYRLVAIYARALTPAEVKSNLVAGPERKAPGKVAAAKPAVRKPVAPAAKKPAPAPAPAPAPTAAPAPPAPAPALAAAPVGGSVTKLPARVVGGYWAYWNGPKISTIPKSINTIYLFSARPVGGQPGSTGAVYFEQGVQSAASFRSDLAAVRAEGRAVILSMCGAGEYLRLDTRARTTAFVNSVKQIYADLGGFDGLDWNIESTEVYPAEMVWASQQLKAAFGQSFAITYPPAPWRAEDHQVARALAAAGMLDFVAPQFYDLTGLNTEAAKRDHAIANLQSVWLPIVGGDASKLGIGFKNVGAPSETMTVGTTIEVWNAMSARAPALRGAFTWELAADAGIGNAFANQVGAAIRD